MRDVGTVHALFISRRGKESPLKKSELQLDPRGIIDDKHYDTTPERAILVTSLESYDMALRELGVEMPHGYLGENLLVDFNLYRLPVGTHLRIGSTVLEITQNCTLCNHLSALDKRIPKLLKDDRGIFAKVISGGSIKEGDSILLTAEFIDRFF